MTQNQIELPRQGIVIVDNLDGTSQRFARSHSLIPIYSKDCQVQHDSFLIEERLNYFQEYYKTIGGETKKSNVIYHYNPEI